ncbi:MAG: ABC transporter permease subunit [Dehalococcoidia bacterium]|nr:ABC transporter permease subunit [Dehalococcoidia bacterium]
MARYMGRRLLLVIPTVIGITILASLMVRLLPGSALELLVVQQGGTEEDRDRIESELGLDRSWVAQYTDWVGGAATGDFGDSLITRRSIGEELERRLPVTMEMGLLALFFSSAIAIPVGIISAVNQDKLVDHFVRSLAIGAVAIPGFWLGTLVMVWPAKLWGWSPPLEYIDLWVDPIANLKQMWIPSLLLGIALSGAEMRMTRTMMVEVLRQDYIRTARAKGLAGRVVVARHALSNAMIPVITLIGIQVPFVVSGTVVLESIFLIPGVGTLMLESLATRDFPVIQAVVLMMAIVVLVANLLTDITYTMLDPRIRLSG